MNFKKIRMIFFSVIFVVQNSFVFAAQATINLPDTKSKSNLNDSIYMRDFGNVRVFTKGRQQIVINKIDPKNPNAIQNVVYSNDTLQYTLRRAHNVAILDLKVSSQAKHHHLVYKFEQNQKTKVAYYTVQRTKYFQEKQGAKPTVASAISTDADSKKCSMAPLWVPNHLKKIADAISDSKSLETIKADNLIDEKSCEDLDPDDKKSLTKSLDQLFKQNGKTMIGCLQTNEAIKTLNNDSALQLQTNLFISRITGFLATDKSDVVNEQINFSDKNKNIKSNFKIKCGPDTEFNNKMACFKDDGLNPAIFINIKKISRKNPKDAESEIDQDQLKKTLLHEFYHTGAQQISSENDKNCLDELIANNLTKLCGADKTTQEISDAAKKCVVDTVASAKEGETCIDKQKCHKSISGIGALTAQVAVNTDVQVAQQQIQSGTSTVAPNKLELISNEPATAQLSLNSAAIGTPPSTTSFGDGEIRAVTNPAVASATNNMFKYFSNTPMASTLGVVAAAAIAPTVANASSNNSQPVMPNSNFTGYPLSAVKADQFNNNIATTVPVKLPQNQIISSSAIQNNTDVAARVTNNSVNAKNDVMANTKMNKSEVTLQQATEKIQSAQSSLNTTNTASDVQVNRSIASINSKASPKTSVTEATTKPISQWVQAIQATQEVGGTNYSAYKNFYITESDKLSSELRLRKIYIQSAAKDANGKFKTYGDSKNADYIFIDNGQRLIRQK